MPIFPPDDPVHRRSFLHAAAAAAALLPATLLAQKTTGQEQHERYYDVTTNEGLMREHGILKRVLVMYDEVIRRIEARQDFPAQTVIDSAKIIRNYIEDYHQKLEDEHIFPLFRQYYRRKDVLRLYAQKLVDLVAKGLKIWARQLDLRHENEVRSFCQELKSEGLTFGVIDTSDVPNSSDTGTSVAAHYVKVISQYAADSAIFMNTAPTGGHGVRWSYFAFSNRKIRSVDRNTIQRWYAMEMKKISATETAQSLLDDPDAMND